MFCSYAKERGVFLHLREVGYVVLLRTNQLSKYMLFRLEVQVKNLKSLELPKWIDFARNLLARVTN